MTRVVKEAALDREAAEAVLNPRTGIVREATVERGRFEAIEGPFSSYTRTVTTEPERGNLVRTTQVIDFDLAVPWVGWLFRLPLRRRLSSFDPPAAAPWWLPPARIDVQAARGLTALSAVSLLAGYLGSVLTQTITYAGREFGAGNGPQGVSLSVTRADVVISIFLVAAADRRGRRRLLLWSTTIGTILTALGALSPSLAWLTASQVLARGFVTAASILVVVVAAEEVAAGARAYAISILFLTGALGAGGPVALLSIASLGTKAWRLLFVIPMVGLLALPAVARHVPESRRFKVATASSPLRSHSKRLWLLIASQLLLYIVVVPASQYRNQFLRTERAFSAPHISLFNLLTYTPGGIGVVLGGRLADVRGRRVVGAVALLVGAAATTLSFFTRGWEMWTWAVAASVFGSAVVPTLGVYGPELFPTSLRGKANGTLYVSNRVASVAGLLFVGLLSGRIGGIGPPIAMLAAGPLILAVLMLTVFPETAGLELEDINPEDRKP